MRFIIATNIYPLISNALYAAFYSVIVANGIFLEKVCPNNLKH